MSVEEEYYINLHVEGKFVRDPHVRYLGGEAMMLKRIQIQYHILSCVK
ncbi:hypothetical protein Gotri_027007 [Gossypium trilobum]|uniref:Uncharacterized protein n=1 Tax=Gossypium trilobum TaxID=34281 RepID=A0A7J9FVW9_9ROSI|nr:hypothetical protein [Gossypium trilobum]